MFHPGHGAINLMHAMISLLTRFILARIRNICRLLSFILVCLISINYNFEKQKVVDPMDGILSSRKDFDFLIIRRNFPWSFIVNMNERSFYFISMFRCKILINRKKLKTSSFKGPILE